MFTCLQTIKAAKETATAKAFKTYSRLILRAAGNGGELDPQAISDLATALAELQRPLTDAERDIADIIELGRCEQLAAALPDAQKQYTDAVELDAKGALEISQQLATLKAWRDVRVKFDQFDVGDSLKFERESIVLEQKERARIEAVTVVRSKASRALQDAGEAAKSAAALRVRLQPIFRAAENGAEMSTR